MLSTPFTHAMQTQALRLRAITYITGLAALAFSGWAGADPPSRVARLGYVAGAVSFSPAGENDWVQAMINWPLGPGDRLWTDVDARAEIQVGGAMIRMNSATGTAVLSLDDRIAQLQLTQGTLNIRVRYLAPEQVFEVDTPNLAFSLRQAGEYRIEVDPGGNATTIVVRQGQGEVYGENAAYAVDARQAYRFMGTGLRDYQLVNAPRFDEFDRWASGRDRRYDNSDSARYVSQDVVGYQDLDANGTWRADATYGNVWVPNGLPAGWAPYRDGHWAWVDPWGWTWVDDAPWGFAVSHYGRWTNLDGRWAWVPGPVRSRAYYAPALIVFVGGANFQLAITSGNVAGVAWFPLGPREIYRPAYPVSRAYYENINRSNTVVNNTVINNTYNNSNVTQVVYANRQVPGAVVAVPATAFVQSQPVARMAVRVSRETIVSAPLAVGLPVAPIEISVRGAAAQGANPPPRVFERPVVARTAPPAVHVGFAAQRQQLAANPGKPLDDAARKQLKPAPAAPLPVVKVIAPTPDAPRTLRPPPSPGAATVAGRGKSDERRAPAAPAISVTPGAPAQGVGQSQATPSPSTAQQLPDQRGRFEQRAKGEQRGQIVAPPPPPSPGATQPQVAAPQAPPAGPAAQSPEPRGKSEQPGNREQRGQSVAPPPTPQRTTEPQSAPPQAAPAAAAAPTPPQRSTQPSATPTPQGGPPAPAAQAKPEPAPAAKQAEPHPPVAAPNPPPQQAAPKAEPREQKPKPAEDAPNDKKKDSGEPRRDG